MKRSPVMKVMVFLTALALLLISLQFLEFLVPRVLGVTPLDPNLATDRAAYAAAMSRLPSKIYIGFLVTHLLASIVGGLVLALGELSQVQTELRWSRSVLLLAAAATLLGTALNYLLPGLPLWYRVLDVLMYAPGVILGYRWVQRTRLLVAERSRS